MSELDEATFRVTAQAQLIGQTAAPLTEHFQRLEPAELATWVADHSSLTVIFADEVRCLGGSLDAVSASSATVDDHQRVALEASTALNQELASVHAEIARTRDRLLHVAVAAEQAEDCEQQLSQRIATIRRLLS